LTDNLAGFIICSILTFYTTPPPLGPVTLWQLYLADGRVASATRWSGSPAVRRVEAADEDAVPRLCR
jgi:hypothetical protein